MMRLATVFASVALVSAKAVEEDAEVDFEELFEGRFLSSNNGTNTTTTTPGVTTTTTTTTASTDTTTTTGAPATPASITVKVSAVLAIPTASFTGANAPTDDATFATNINLASDDTNINSVVVIIKNGFVQGYNAMTFGTTACLAAPPCEAPAGSTTTDTYAWSTARRGRQLATGDIGDGKTLDMTFETTGITVAAAEAAQTKVGATDAASALTGMNAALNGAFALAGVANPVVVTSVAAPTATVDDGSTDTATTTAASSAAGLGLPIVAALASAVLMF